MPEGDHGDSTRATYRGRPLTTAAALLLVLFVTGACARTSPLRNAPRYSAYGSDPGWLLTVGRGRLQFTAEPDLFIKFPVISPVPTGTGHRYRGDNLIVDVEQRPCRDRKSGLAFRDTVRVAAGRLLLGGCGGPRMPLLDT